MSGRRGRRAVRSEAEGGLLTWTDHGDAGAQDGGGPSRRSARWRSESGAPPPPRVVVADDRMKADDAYRLACEGTALLWQGDFQNARQLLQAMARRAARPPKRARRKRRQAAEPPPSPSQAFHLYRQAQAQRARTLGMLLIPVDAGHVVPLRRAPDLRQACLEAYGPCDEPYVVSLRELLGVIGAHEWRAKGVPVPALGGDRIHPHYGVFSPVRGEYVSLVAEAPLPASKALAYDVGTGTGVLAAVLARRGFERVIATDQDPRALACADDNITRLGSADRVDVVEADMWPPSAPQKPSLVVCNPPWVPARPSSPLEHAVYDPGSRMLRAFLAGLADHLAPDGEGWLILSDLAEHLGLRTRAELLDLVEAGGLKVAGRLDAKPVHPRAADPGDPLHQARAAEVTSLWRLVRA